MRCLKPRPYSGSRTRASATELTRTSHCCTIVLAQALELDRRNVDAHVARGAALANQKQWPQAIAALDMALGA